MKRCGLLLLFACMPAFGMTPEGREFLDIMKKLERVQCEKSKLRRAIALAEIEKRDAEAKALRKRFAELNRDPETARLEKRLGVLQRRMSDGHGGVRDPEDLSAISLQQREAFYRCE